MKKEQSIRKIGKLMLAISSCGVLLTAFQADKSVFAEDATTTEATTAAAATERIMSSIIPAKVSVNVFPTPCKV